jgi:hypothetical protein
MLGEKDATKEANIAGYIKARPGKNDNYRKAHR